MIFPPAQSMLMSLPRKWFWAPGMASLHTSSLSAVHRDDPEVLRAEARSRSWASLCHYICLPASLMVVSVLNPETGQFEPVDSKHDGFIQTQYGIRETITP